LINSITSAEADSIIDITDLPSESDEDIDGDVWINGGGK